MKYKINTRSDSPKGTNDDKLKDVFSEKDKYEKMTVNYPFEPDFFNTRAHITTLYGKVDDLGFSVVPNREYMSPVESKGGQTYFLPTPVLESFNSMKEHYEELRLQNKINVNFPYLKKIELVRAHKNVVDSYNNYIKSRFEEFHNNLAILDEVKNYKDYENKVRGLVLQLVNRSLPFTMSEYIVSKENHPYQTGLVVHIADEDSSDDSLKFEGFHTNPNFSIYQKVAYRYGFRVDKNCPWALYYDITSPYARKKLRPMGVHSLADFFETFYIKVVDFEQRGLMDKICNLYEGYRRENPEYTKLTPCSKSRTSLYPRERMNTGILSTKYSYKHWIRLYAYIRAVETSKDWNQNQFNKLVSQTCNYYNYRDEKHALRMLERNFTDRTKELFQKRDLTKENSFDRIITDFRF